MLSFFRLSDVTFAREWPIDRAVWVMRQMKPARVGSLLAEMHNLIGPNWTSQILMTLHVRDSLVLHAHAARMQSITPGRAQQTRPSSCLPLPATLGCRGPACSAMSHS